MPVKELLKILLKEGNFVTGGCYKTAEIFFAAATNCMPILKIWDLVIHLHINQEQKQQKGLLVTCKEKSQIQSLDAQPNVGDVISKTSNVQFNQVAEDRLLHRGVKKQLIANRRRVSHSLKKIEEIGRYVTKNHKIARMRQKV